MREKVIKVIYAWEKTQQMKIGPGQVCQDKFVEFTKTDLAWPFPDRVSTRMIIGRVD